MAKKRQEKKRINKKKIIIGIVIALILIAIASYSIYYYTINKKINEDLNKINIASLKYIKCLTNCPSETIMNITILNTECNVACQDKYLLPEKENIELYAPKFENDTDKFVLNGISDSCYGKIKLLNEFRQCLNDSLNEYQSIIDLSNLEISAIFPIINLKIIDAKCTNNEVTIKIRRESGDLSQIAFLILTQTEAKVVKNSTLPDINKTLTYKIIYEKEGILTKPVEIGIAGILGDRLSSVKDKISC